jgi:hypothetical protein
MLDPRLIVSFAGTGGGWTLLAPWSLVTSPANTCVLCLTSQCTISASQIACQRVRVMFDLSM